MVRVGRFGVVVGALLFAELILAGFQAQREPPAPEPFTGDEVAVPSAENTVQLPNETTTLGESISGSPAEAPMEPEPVPSLAEGATRHCVASLDKSDAVATECFVTFRSAIAYATDGRIIDAPTNVTAAAENQKFLGRLFAPQEASSTGETTTQTEKTTASEESGDFSTQNHNNTISGCCTVLSVEYEHAQYQGNTLTFRASSGCDNDPAPEWRTPNVGADWNDEISSFIASGRCTEAHFEHDFYNGRATGRQAADRNMGGFNDLTTSILWY